MEFRLNLASRVYLDRRSVRRWLLLVGGLLALFLASSLLYAYSNFAQLRLVDSRLEKLLPDDVAIRSLQPNYRDHSLHITAVARDTAAMTGLLDALLASADMQQAFLLNQSPGEQPDGESVVQFTIVIREAF